MCYQNCISLSIMNKTTIKNFFMFFYCLDGINIEEINNISEISSV